MWPGSAVRAARTGIVETVVRDAPNYPGFHRGNRVTVRHRDGSVAIYAHLDGPTIRVRAGDPVATGATIAKVGMSGQTLYPHLHFQVRDAANQAQTVTFRDLHPDPWPVFGKAYQAKPTEPTKLRELGPRE